jgi:hypothetical protein
MSDLSIEFYLKSGFLMAKFDSSIGELSPLLFKFGLHSLKALSGKVSLWLCHEVDVFFPLTASCR